MAEDRIPGFRKRDARQPTRRILWLRNSADRSSVFETESRGCNSYRSHQISRSWPDKVPSQIAIAHRGVMRAMAITDPRHRNGN